MYLFFNNLAHAATTRSKAASVKTYQWLQAASGLPKHNAVHTGSASASVNRRQLDVSFNCGVSAMWGKSTDAP